MVKSRATPSPSQLELTFVWKKRGFIGQSSTLTGIRRHRKIRDLRRVLRNCVIEARTEINHRETKKGSNRLRRMQTLKETRGRNQNKADSVRNGITRVCKKQLSSSFFLSFYSVSCVTDLIFCVLISSKWIHFSHLRNLVLARCLIVIGDLLNGHSWVNSITQTHVTLSRFIIDPLFF